MQGFFQPSIHCLQKYIKKGLHKEKQVLNIFMNTHLNVLYFTPHEDLWTTD